MLKRKPKNKEWIQSTNMMFNRPHFKEYVMARLVTISVALFIVFSILLFVFVSEEKDAYVAIALLGLGFTVFVYAIYHIASRMQKELSTINQHLSNLDKVEKIAYTAHFFTQEFEDLNQNLIKVLKSAKKREDVKQRYNAKLKLKNRQRSDMLSAIAHEFRNPIASIMGYSETLQDDPNITQELREKFLGKIHKNGEKIEDLLSRLILWNKFETKEMTLHPVKFDIYALMQEVSLSLEEQYQSRTIVVQGESHTVEADKTLIEIVLKNLVENALKYSKKDVMVSFKEGKISVSDKGVGINEKDIEKVTKKFYRSGSHNWDNSMGLGLAIVKTILSLHKSKLEIESKMEVGSTFSFKI